MTNSPTFAASHDARVAGMRDDTSAYSLSPHSLLAIPPGTRLVLPSPNGSTLSLTTGATPTFAGCLRNARAVAEAAHRIGPRVAVIAAGERWRDDGSLRPCFEDQAGAGRYHPFPERDSITGGRSRGRRLRTGATASARPSAPLRFRPRADRARHARRRRPRRRAERQRLRAAAARRRISFAPPLSTLPSLRIYQPAKTYSDHPVSDRREICSPIPIAFAAYDTGSAGPPPAPRR